MLQLLLHAAERDVRIGLTVTVGGVVVTGTLVGTVTYCRALADQFASTAGGTGMDEVFADALGRLVDDEHQPADATTFGFLHLADARYVSGPGMLPHGHRGILWRGRVADVTSWSLGDLMPG